MIECPHNYFGRGVDFQLPDNPIVIQEIQLQWAKWELAHPDDPTGEKAYADWLKTGQPEEIKSVKTKTEVSSPVEDEDDEEEVSDDTVKLKLELPKNIVRMLKNFAKMKRKRPRDIIVAWVTQHAKL